MKTKKPSIKIYKKIVQIASKTPLKKVKSILKLDTYIRSKLKSDFVINKYGNKIFLDKQDSLRLSLDNKVDESEIKFIEDTIKEGDIVIDIGGHIGFYTLIFSKLVGEKGKVYTFEPNPNNFELLEKNIKVNNIKNVILINKALSNKKGIAKLYLNKDNSGCHSLFKQGKEFDNFVEVETTTLDDYFGMAKVNFIKIDAEGSEGYILQGGEKLLSNREIKIFTEFNLLALDSSGFLGENYLKLFKAHNFKFNSTNERGELVPVRINELLHDNIVKNILCKK